MKFPFVIIARSTLEMLNGQLAEVKQERQWLIEKLADKKPEVAVEEEVKSEHARKRAFSTPFDKLTSRFDEKYPVGAEKPSQFRAKTY